MLKRRKALKTDYKRRLGLLKSRKTRVVVRRSLNYIHVQFVKYEKDGDKILLEDTSKNLRKYGWLAHCNNLPAAYLTGLLSGYRAKKAGVKGAVLDVGLQTTTKGNAIFATVSGLIASGIKIPVDEKILPDKDRVAGKHIAGCAKSGNQFSDYSKKGLNPEKIPEHFEEIKNKIKG